MPGSFHGGHDNGLIVMGESAFAWYTVALRFKPLIMKSQIGFGSSQMMLKHLQRLIFSITSSITSDFAAKTDGGEQAGLYSEDKVGSNNGCNVY